MNLLWISTDNEPIANCLVIGEVAAFSVKSTPNRPGMHEVAIHLRGNPVPLVMTMETTKVHQYAKQLLDELQKLPPRG